MKQWYVIRLIASIGFLAATVYMVYEMAMQRPMAIPIILFLVMLFLYGGICLIVRKKAEKEK